MNLISSNGFIPILPIMLFNLLFSSKLPEEFESKIFDSDIPVLIDYGEKIFRILIFGFSFFVKTDVYTSAGRIGLIIYIVGVLMYFLSWLPLIFAPSSSWSKSIIGFTAPAYTPVVWLSGCGLMFNSYYFDVPYAPVHYFIPAILFLLLHVLHTVIVYKRKIS
jgi:hypothetical protein